MGDMTTEQLLAERATTHGEYADHARCTQAILNACMREKNWHTLPDIVKESMHMIAHKMGRVSTGNPLIPDHWDDIAGYARLVSQRITDPKVAYEPDIYEGLARIWGVSRAEAQARYLGELYAAGSAAVAEDLSIEFPSKPGTPEDGGHHASQEENQ